MNWSARLLTILLVSINDEQSAIQCRISIQIVLYKSKASVQNRISVVPIFLRNVEFHSTCSPPGALLVFMEQDAAKIFHQDFSQDP